ncbi:unnamed protein product [Notodromas monacha]|uniref:C2 domain-containing protein n=1 Tax=Notodromas monacha TaxID=399045 RepID=A0A7R9GBJ8_9CRUS|nr:unnamed protein product [Notodromas monacha]CAG0916442.1 unnamed protein product [Notodromas monacha]
MTSIPVMSPVTDVEDAVPSQSSYRHGTTKIRLTRLPDPFAKVFVESTGQCHSTDSCKSTLHPKWNQHYDLSTDGFTKNVPLKRSCSRLDFSVGAIVAHHNEGKGDVVMMLAIKFTNPTVALVVSSDEFKLTPQS